ncbi:metal ABC transporter substrate-binding protein [Micromonospora sp. NPDC049559]|uniref:metal ABC transporter substrate-binding protein n=1 Tax=Micromonospora sp. NPDC049559 TaxID=3155923 RepID=UPI0034377B23
MMIRSRPAAALAAGALLALAGAAGCSATVQDDPGRVDVVAAFYPLQYVAERVGGDAVRVVNLVKPGAEPHDLELNPGQVAEVSGAELVIYLKGFQPAVDEAVEQNAGDRVFDAATVQPLADATGGNHAGEPAADGEEHAAEKSGAAKDPHVWLDPTRLATIADRFAERLGKADPQRAADYTARARTLRADLEGLDREYQQGLRDCQRRDLVTSHTAFGYLADRYHLSQIGISGVTPEDEPSPQRLAEVARAAREHGATTIFFETLVSPKVAETIAREVGAKTAVLDPIEGLQPGTDGDYVSVMRTNLTALKTALSCT